MVHMTTFERAYQVRGLQVSRWVLGSEHLPYYGAQALIACRSEDRAIKAGDRLVVVDLRGDKAKLIDRNAPHAPPFRVPSNHIKPAIRRFAYLPTLDATAETDVCIAKPSVELETIMESIYGKKDSKTYLKRIKESGKKWKGGKWAARVEQGSSNVCIVRRTDFSAPGTTVLAAWTAEPSFLAGDGYIVRGLKEKREGHFLVLWLNSTIALIKILGNMTITRGTWAKIEEFMLAKVPVPAYWHFTPEEWETVETLWKRVKLVALPSLMEQLREDNAGREEIDQTLLGLLGVPEKERGKVAGELRAGALEALTMLQQTMTYDKAAVEPTEDENDEDAGG